MYSSATLAWVKLPFSSLSLKFAKLIDPVLYLWYKNPTPELYVKFAKVAFVTSFADWVVLGTNLHLTSVNEDSETAQLTPSTETETSALSKENPVPLIVSSCPLMEPVWVVSLTRGKTTNWVS